MTNLEYNPQHLTLANGSTDRTVKYWDLETFQSVSQTRADSQAISHLAFSELNAEHLFAVSQDNLKVWNIENNKLLDFLSVPPKRVTDLGISYARRFLLLSCLQANTLSVYYTSLDSINFDEDVDTVPEQPSQPRPSAEGPDPMVQQSRPKATSVNMAREQGPAPQQQAFTPV